MYMSSVEKINEDQSKKIPGVTHIDGTGRVQTVSKLLTKIFINLFGIFIICQMCQFYSIHHSMKMSQ